MGSFVWWIVVMFVNGVQSDGSVNWLCVSRRNPGMQGKPGRQVTCIHILMSLYSAFLDNTSMKKHNCPLNNIVYIEIWWRNFLILLMLLEVRCPDYSKAEEILKVVFHNKLLFLHSPPMKKRFRTMKKLVAFLSRLKLISLLNRNCVFGVIWELPLWVMNLFLEVFAEKWLFDKRQLSCSGLTSMKHTEEHDKTLSNWGLRKLRSLISCVTAKTSCVKVKSLPVSQQIKEIVCFSKGSITI